MTQFDVTLRDFTINHMGTWLVHNVGPIRKGWMFQELNNTQPQKARITIQEDMMVLQFKMMFTEHIKQVT